jgi:nucleoporin NUP159
VAAAGPDYIAFSSTESVRKAFEAPKEGDSDVRNYEPQLKINMPMRISQLAFTADENYLLLSAESGGGIAAYEVQSLLQGSTNSTFELSTNGESLRAMVPNPTSEKAELCAIVTQSGNLHMANLRDKSLSNALKAQVSCLSWSAKGKQLCAGLADGSVYQMTPEGEAKAEIPKPPSLVNCHVSTLTWLENNRFLVIHSTNDSPPSSIYHIITRQPPASFNYQKITDPVEPFGSEKTPHHSVLRLRNFPPDLDDLLIVSSTASTEIGLLSRSKKPLASDQPENLITGVFTTTELLDDTKRPTLPMTESMDDSMPVGLALDLSSKEKVYRPIPSDEELNESPTPVPGLWVLTHEGILCSWWVIYADSVKQGTTYPGLAVAGGAAASTASAQAPAQAAPASTPSAFSTGGSAFGSTAAATPAFGSSSQLGQKASAWGGAASPGAANSGGATFGSSTFGNAPATPNAAFGKPSAVGFGQSGQLGMRTSPWAAGGGPTPAFGQSGFSSFANKNNGSPFGSGAQASPNAGNESNAPSSGGFAGFAKQGGFASLAGNNSGGSAFGSGSQPSPSPFGTKTTSESPFAAKQDTPTSTPFGSTPFKLESSFKPDPAAQEDASKPAASGSPFGSGFGSALTEASKETSSAKDEDMDASEDHQPQEQTKSPFAASAAAPTQQKSLFGAPSSNASQPQAPAKNPFASVPDASTQLKNPFALPANNSSQPGAAKNPFATTTDSTESTTPPSTPAPSRFGAPTSPAPGASLFGQPTKLGSSFGGGSLFGSSKETTPAAPSGGLFSQSRDIPKAPEAQRSEPKIKSEDELEAPLPPDTTSKISYPLGESSSSSVTSSAPSQLFDTPGKPESAPLPPFGASSKSTKATEDAPLPPFIAGKKDTTDDAPLPPFTTGRSKPADGGASSLFGKTIKPATDDAPLPPDPTKAKSPSNVEEPPLPPSFIAPKAPSKEASQIPSIPDESEEESEGEFETESEVDEGEEEGEEEEEEYDEHDDENATEGSGVDVAKDLSPGTSGVIKTPGFTPQSSFGGLGGATPATARQGQQGASKPLFGEVSRNAPLFSKPSDASPRSPSPMRGAVPNRVIRSEGSRSVSAPGMASQILGHRQPPSHLGASITSRQQDATDPFMVQHRKQRERQEAAEAQPLVDEEDDEIQKILASEVEGTLELDEFIAHSNVAPPAKESVPAQVEAVYRDINSMIDTVGLNARSIQAFTKGHTENGCEEARSQDDLDSADGWVLCEIEDLGNVLDEELYEELENGRVENREEKLEACQELARDMHRLRTKQEDLKRVILARMDPDQADVARSLPLNVEQAAQQNELRREFGNFTKLLAEAEEALTLLKARIASVSGSSGKGSGNVPTVEAVMRTITKMTTMVEKRSGDIDVLETQLRKMRLSSVSREGSPMMTPQARRSIMMSPDSTPSRNLRGSISSNSMLFGASARATPPRKKLSGFSKEEKGDLMERRARRQAVLSKLKGSVEKRGVNVWNMEDIE